MTGGRLFAAFRRRTPPPDHKPARRGARRAYIPPSHDDSMRASRRLAVVGRLFFQALGAPPMPK